MISLENCRGLRDDAELTLVHGNTTDGRTDVQPSASASLAELSVMVVGVAGDANRSARILTHSSDFAALKPDIDVLSGDNLDTVGRRFFFFTFDDGKSTGTPAKHGTSLRVRADVIDGGTNRDQVHGKAVSPMRRLGCQDTWINDTTHAVQQFLGNARPVAVEHITGSRPLWRNDICLVPRRLFVHKCNMCAPVGVVLDALHHVRPREPAVEVDGAYSSLCATSVVSDCDPTIVVSATLGHALLRERQR